MTEEGPGGSIRIGDTEREDAVKRLGEHYQAGRLSADEHSERVEQALRARTAEDLINLFVDLPGAHQAPAAGEGAAADAGGEGWAGPWGWRKPPWTAPENAAGATGPSDGPGGGAGGRPGGPGWSGGGAGGGPGWAGGWWGAAAGQGESAAGGAGAGRPGGPGGPGGPPWGRRGFFGRVPLPVLIALGVLGVLASVGCVVGGGHPPVLPIVLIVAAVFVVRKRRMERRA
ncbi:DUF1707 domain-containing protein [Kribbella solani]|uniref:DUF1707 SHOCT-like domain-containing protein n=1 Tax=Kribbella solani TaxID=236067 RepID=UPI0029A99B7C|nr:DUF1707 domain-containing protein [Kribbella solani]MDX3004510.1 DUF1707 domain-containing protein [Kribbella solani]